MKSGEPQQPDAASFWAKLRAESRHAYPNPTRQGCPSDDFLRQLATDRSSVAFDDPRVSHVVRCSPCFQQMEEYMDDATVPDAPKTDARDDAAPSAK
jgi:hypothetical protein